MRIGIDLGGTKIESIVLDGSEVRHRARIATPTHDYDALVDALVAVVADAERAIGARASVGIAAPGAVSPTTGIIKNANLASMNGRALHRDLARRLQRDVRMHNDANCFALSEASDGAGRGAEIVFGVILGTGVGGGIVVRGAALTGHNAIAGEWGHNPLPRPLPSELPGPACYCRRHGCIETFLAGPALERDHEHATGEFRSAADIAARADAGDPGSAATLARYHDRLARGLASVVNVLDPNVIVLGGGVSKIASLYREVPKLWERYVFSDRITTQLLPAEHGDASGVRGAAWLWPE